ncbi:MAG: DUF4397 domain-containing protein, partial [Gammaproteobacteria bacterium]|nr:DUF4397 domain-containing protein [Gammaproteobacteria bacterium]
MRLFLAACALLTFFFLSGCGSEDGFTPESPPAGLLRVFNAIPDSPGLIVNFENQSVGFIEFGTSSAFIQVLPEVTRTLRVSFIENRAEITLIGRDVEIAVNDLLTAVIAGTMNDPQLILISDIPPEFAADGTISELRIVHAATAATETVNFHLTADDVPAGNPLVSVSRNSATELFTIEASDNARLRVFNSDSALLWDSGSFNFVASARPLFLLQDYFGPGDSVVRAVSVGASAASSFPSEIITSSARFANMVSDRTAVDLYLDGALMAEGLLFGDVGDYQDLDAGDYTVTVTTANSIDDVIAETSLTAVSGEFHTVIATGIGEFNGTLSSQDDLRRVASRAHVAFSNVSPTAGVSDLYILQPGQSITDFLPSLSGISSPGNQDIRIIPGIYELTLTQSGTRTVTVGPQQINVSADGLYRVYFTD